MSLNNNNTTIFQLNNKKIIALAKTLVAWTNYLYFIDVQCQLTVGSKMSSDASLAEINFSYFSYRVYIFLLMQPTQLSQIIAAILATCTVHVAGLK